MHHAPGCAGYGGEAGHDGLTRHVASAEGAGLLLAYGLNRWQLGEVATNLAGIRVVQHLPLAIHQVERAGLPQPLAHEGAVEGVHGSRPQPEHAAQGTLQRAVAAQHRHGGQHHLFTFTFIADENTGPGSRASVAKNVFPDQSWPTSAGWGGSVIRTAVPAVQQHHAGVEHGQSVPGALQGRLIRHGAGVVHIQGPAHGIQEAGEVGQDAGDLACGQAGDFLVPLDGQVLGHLLVGVKRDQGHRGQDDGRGHEGPGDDLCGQAAAALGRRRYPGGSLGLGGDHGDRGVYQGMDRLPNAGGQAGRREGHDGQ